MDFLFRETARLGESERANQVSHHEADIAGWLADGDTWTYASASTFTIAGDVTSKFGRGDKLRWKQGAGYLYAYVVSAVYGAPNTTITVCGGDAVATPAAITDNYYSKAASPQGMPYGSSAFIPLATPLTSTSWDGDAKTAANSGTLDLSAVFGVPAGVKAVAVRGSNNSAAASRYLALGAASGGGNMAVVCRTQVANVTNDFACMVPCDANGDIYITISADLAAVNLFITGYWL